MKAGLFAVTGIAAAASLLFTIIQAPSVRADQASVSYPDGYRAWTFLHSSLAPAGFVGFAKSPWVKPCTNGIFYFYGNDQAMAGLRTGVYTDGAVIAEEMLEYRIGENGNGGEGRRVLTAVMVKDSSRYAATGGWGFGNFDEGSKANTLDAKAQQACFQCHISCKDHGYVFTQYIERQVFTSILLSFEYGGAIFMRKLIVSEFITLDGVIQAPGGKDEDRDGGFEHGGWTMPYWHDDIGAGFVTLMQDADALLVGRRTPM